MKKTIIFEHDYLTEIRDRLSVKSDILNISNVADGATVPRSVVAKFAAGQIANTSFENIVKLYKFIVENNI